MHENEANLVDISLNENITRSKECNDVLVCNTTDKDLHGFQANGRSSRETHDDVSDRVYNREVENGAEPSQAAVG